MPTRGESGFEVNEEGKLLYTEANIERLRKLLLDRTILSAEQVGSGNAHDYDNGAWHVFCHVAAACAVYRRKGGDFIWAEISHVPLLDLYFATVTVDGNHEGIHTFSLVSPEGAGFLEGAQLLGYVEGSSLGHISARGVKDPPGRFNGWMRQDYDQDPASLKHGGRVWEHWCTTRDIRKESSTGTSVLRSCVALASTCGDSFITLAARGRRSSWHPQQLKAMVRGGFVSREAAVLDIRPTVIPRESEPILYSADPRQCLAAAKAFQWSEDGLSYFMHGRRIYGWSSSAEVGRDVGLG